MVKWFLICIAAVFLSGCNPQPDAIIHWHKVGACNGGTEGNPDNVYNVGPNAAYVVFAVESVDNSQVNQAWTIDAVKFHVGSANFDPSLMIYRWVLGPFALQTYAVPAKSSISFSTNAYGALVVSTSKADGASEADTANYSLLYAPTSGDPGVIMIQGADASTAYTPNCGDVVLK